MTRQEEQQFVSLILTGDKAALRQLYNLLFSHLQKYVKTRVDINSDAEEICQDAFINFVDALPLFSHQSSLWTFLISITKHEIADYYRRQYAKKTIKSIPLLGNLYDQKLNNSALTAQKLHEAIESVYSLLKPSHSQILRLKYQEKQSIKYIAQTLGVSLKAAESQLYRARVAFQQVYTQLYGQPSFSVLQ